MRALRRFHLSRVKARSRKRMSALFTQLSGREALRRIGRWASVHDRPCSCYLCRRGHSRDERAKDKKTASSEILDALSQRAEET